MITLAQYFGGHAHAEEHKKNATILLDRANRLLHHLESLGAKSEINPVTKSQVSGATFGGFRPQSCPQGAPESSHKIGKGIDVFDPHNALDNALTDAILTAFDLYREAPNATEKWLHITTRAPRSGRRTFNP